MIHPRERFSRLPRQRRQKLLRVVKRPLWGNLRRLEPFSSTFGFDRGTPIDRYYIHDFIGAHADAIRGVTGEVSESSYIDEFGGEDVEKVEVIDLSPDNPRATLIADIAETGSLPDAVFDCLVIVQTLQYTPRPDQALAVCVRALRPGGSLLLAVPALTPHDRLEPYEADHWRFMPAGLDSLLSRVAPGADRIVSGYGNLIVAMAFQQGLSAEELKPRELTHHDPRFPVVVCARVDMPEALR